MLRDDFEETVDVNTNQLLIAYSAVSSEK